MKIGRLSGVLVILAVILAVAACAKPPTEEIDAANSALTRAEADADARQYAPESIARARSLVERMQAEVEAKRYDSAKSLAIEAKTAAEKAITDGAAAKRRAEADASSAISNAKNLLNEVEQALRAAGNVRGISLDIPAAGRDISSAAQAISSAEADFTGADFAGAKSKADDARSALAGIQRRIADAVQAATRRK